MIETTQCYVITRLLHLAWAVNKLHAHNYHIMRMHNNINSDNCQLYHEWNHKWKEAILSGRTTKQQLCS